MVVRAILGALLLVLFPAGSASAATFPTKYDHTIREAAERWLPGVPWKLFKAQLYQESRLDPQAVSPVGAAGIGQFMPATWAEISRSLGYRNVGRAVAEPGINAAAYYMMELKGLFQKTPEYDRHRFGLASYNAGGGNIRKAKTLCGSGTWAETEKCLPKVTGKHSTETITYVSRIWQWWAMMEAGA